MNLSKCWNQIAALACVVGGLLAAPIALAADTSAPAIIGETVGRIVTVIQYLGGLFAIVTLTYAGVLWMQAGHDPYNKDKAKGMVEKAIVGIVLLIIGPSLATWVFGGMLPV
jgi:hypothetical protein